MLVNIGYFIESVTLDLGEPVPQLYRIFPLKTLCN